MKSKPGRIALTWVTVVFANLSTLLAAADQWTAGPGVPESSLNLKLAGPITTWDEAIPLGNGTMGVLLWGESNVLRFSLDRGDLWDERPSKKFQQVKSQFNYATMRRLVAENKMGEFNEIFDSNYDYNGPPSKLPAGRLEIELEASDLVRAFELNLATAEGLAWMGDGGVIRAFVDAGSVEEPVTVVRIPGNRQVRLRLRAPESIKLLGYAPARTGSAAGTCWFEQPGAEGFEYSVCAGSKQVGDSTVVAITVATRDEGKSSLAVARRRVDRALKRSYESAIQEHTGWWEEFWRESAVQVPEAHILQQYYLVRYFYGAASRRGAPPIPLQGVWTADSGGLPPWKGDYHNDLNTQMTYIAYQTAGHFEEGAAFLDLLWDLLPRFRQFAREFYDAPGAAVPGVMSLGGQPLGGWGQYSLSPTMGAWNGHLFYLHWRYNGDKKFLRTRAYPWCREVAECILHLLQPDTNGVLKLPLSSSPEIFDNTRRAFVVPNSNYDLMSMRMLFLALAEMASELGDKSAAEKWAQASRQLGDYHVMGDGTLLISPGTPLPGSHRHLSNLMGLHPFNLITVEGGSRDREIIRASLRQWDDFGTKAWCGYSFSWMSALRARVGDAEAAVRNLDIFTRAFVLRNGFHANGDQTRSGLSDFTYRPFTLEGNFLAMQALQEMLVQSWSETPGRAGPGTIRIFPAMPWRWHEAQFDQLRTEGGHKVSARREQNATTWFRIEAGRTGVVRIQNNFGGRTPQWSGAGGELAGTDFVVRLRRGQVVEARLARPQAIPPAPTDAAAPFMPRKN